MGIICWTRGHWLGSTSSANAQEVAVNHKLNILSQSYEKTSITLGHIKGSIIQKGNLPFSLYS